MAVPVRGLHLYPSQWCDPNDSVHWPWFQRDNTIISTIGNLNSVKTSLFSYAEQGSNQNYWLVNQYNKIVGIRDVAPSGIQWVFRCWPIWAPQEGHTQDWSFNSDGSVNFYESGRKFAHNLTIPFYHVKYNAGLSNVVMEVANEPNVEPPFIGSPSYNDFFRGFYYGQQEVGYNWPLAYTGLSPNGTALSWYQDYWVRNHIQNYAAKVGVHIYYYNGQREVVLDSNNRPQGRYYRWVHDSLANGGVSPKGLVITEFNTPRSQYASDIAQLQDLCSWWEGEYQDATSGYWCEQGLLFVTHTDTVADCNNYCLTDNQVNSGIIQNC